MVGLIYQEEGRNRDYLEEIARNDRGFRSLRDFRTGFFEDFAPVKRFLTTQELSSRWW